MYTVDTVRGGCLGPMFLFPTLHNSQYHPEYTEAGHPPEEGDAGLPQLRGRERATAIRADGGSQGGGRGASPGGSWSGWSGSRVGWEVRLLGNSRVQVSWPLGQKVMLLSGSPLGAQR